MSNTLQQLCAYAQRAFGQGKERLRIVFPDDSTYKEAWQISNSYFYDRNPIGVAFPTTAAQVAWCIMECKKAGIQFRVRSGGHQHEAMSTAKGSLMIRLSEMNSIELDSSDDPQEAWISTGARLKTVYKELGRIGKIIPGGGCGDVNVGGLTQGGGWGLYSRQYGLTCDSLVEAEVVLASGEIVKASTKENKELFWAIRGGGGGNFGIVTRFLFKLVDLVSGASRYRFYWKRERMEEVVNAWVKYQDDFPNELTSFLRLEVRPSEWKDKDPYPIYASGLFQGYKEELELIVAQFMKSVPPDRAVIETRPPSNSDGDSWAQWSTYDVFEDDFYPDSNEETNPEEDPISSCNVLAPTSNCGAPHPHKVSSAFPINDEANLEIAKRVTAYMKGTSFSKWVRSYVSFHSMGGAIRTEREGGRAFPYKDKAFMLQFQSWWNYPDTDGDSCMTDRERQQPYIEWVTKFRERLDGYVEGAFINFVDKDLGPDPSTRKGRIDLLGYYYGKNLERLMEVKRDYDPNNEFNFEMSIPVSDKKKKTNGGS